MKKKKNKSNSIQEALKNLRMAIHSSSKKKKKRSESSPMPWHNRTYTPPSPALTSSPEKSVVVPTVRIPTPTYSEAELAAYRKEEQEANRRRLERYKRQDEYLAERIEHHRWMVRTGGDPYGG